MSLFRAFLLVSSPLLLPSAFAAPGGHISFQKAELAFKAGRYDEALPLFDAALKNAFLTPRDRAHALCRKGIMASLKNNFVEALGNLEPSIKGKLLPPEEQAVCSFALLQIYSGRGQNSEAVALVGAMGYPALNPQYQARVWAFAAESARKIADTQSEVIYLQRLRNVMESKAISEVPLKILGNRVVTLAEVTKRLGAPAPTAPLGSPQPTSSPSSSARASAPPSTAPSSARSSAPMAGASASAPPPHDASSHPAPALAQMTSAGRTTPPNGTHSATAPSNSSSDDRFQKLIAFMNAALDHTQAGSWDGARSRWNLLAERNLMPALQVVSGFRPDVPAIMGRLDNLKQTSPQQFKVGLLVPSDPEFAAVSFRILRAASAFMASPAANGWSVQTYVRGAAADPGAMEQAALELILKDHVHVIIGPISSALSLGATTAARTFGIPLMSLGPVAETLGLQNPYLVRMGIQARSQSTVLVQHLKEQGLNNLAILAPNDAYGMELARSMSAAATEANLPIERTTFYDAESDVFKEGVQTALGPQDPAERKEEFQAAADELRKQAQLQKRKFDPSEVKLPPLIRFDALFIPDTLRKSRVIASTFAFLDAKNIRYIGDRQWAETDNRRSLSDEFLNGARVPVSAPGKHLAELTLQLNRPATSAGAAGLDLERQVFDAFLLARQGHAFANGPNGKRMMQGLKQGSWTVEGTTQMSGLSASGEPLVTFELKGYLNGALQPDVPPWNGETWQEDVLAWSAPQKANRKNEKSGSASRPPTATR